MSLLRTASYVLSALNRIYAHYSFLVNYLLYGTLYLLGGIPPNTDARVRDTEGWNPAVFVGGVGGVCGRELVLRLAREGYTVFAAVADSGDGKLLVDAFKSNRSLRRRKGGMVVPLVCDIADGEALHAAVATISKFGDRSTRKRLVAVVCNSGVCPVAPLEAMQEQTIDVRPLSIPALHALTLAPYQQIISSNLRTYITTTRTFLPLLRAAPHQCRIIYLSSAGGYAPLPGWSVFSAAAAAVDSFARAMTVELAREGVRVSVVRTGWVRGSLPLGIPPAGGRYARMSRSWRTIIRYMAELGTPSDDVAKQVLDALTDRWMQPCYTVGWDALLAQAVRDFVPEPVYEWALRKAMM